MARPLDPRLARALLESKRFRAEKELLAIVAGLSIPDVDHDHIFARQPQPEALAQFPEVAALNALPIDYRFSPGEPLDGASLRIPLLALPGLSRADVDAVVPGFAEPRIEALLRSLPKDARRSLIPIGATAAQFLASTRAGNAHAAADVARLTQWLKDQRGVPDALLRFDSTAVPIHLIPRLTVSAADGKDLATGRSLAQLRRISAAAARAELTRRAHLAYGFTGAWRRFEPDELPDSVPLAIDEGVVIVYPSVAGAARALEVRFEWSAAEAARSWRQGAAHLARNMLAAQARDLERSIAGNVPLLLAVRPYLASDALSEILLQWVFSRACFEDAAAPRTRAAFENAVDRGRPRLHPCLEETLAAAAAWFSDARVVRAAQVDAETHEHLARLLSVESLQSMQPEWLRQLPRYLKAEERRWQRRTARGIEPPHIVRELREWSVRCRTLAHEVGAELRWIPQLDDLEHWIEEYRVSLYAQELKTLGPVSAARLAQRAAEIEAWITR